MIEDNNVEIDAIIEDDSVNLETDLDYRGERGPVGETPDITIGKVDTLSPEDNAYVEKEGTKENITLNFGIPKGKTGDIGPVGPTGPSGVYIGSDEPQDPEVDVWIDPTVNPDNYVKETELDDKLNSMIESGELIGPPGSQGVPGNDGTDGTDGIGITTIISGQPTIEEDKTVTPVTVNKTDGSSQSFKVEAKNGIDGQNGKDGTNGQDGLTPIIGDNGNWYLGDTDTGKPSRGEVGPSPDLSDYVKNTDYANGITGGTVKSANQFFVTSSNGYVYSGEVSKDAYKSIGNSSFISKGTLENIKDDYVGSSTPVKNLNNSLRDLTPKQDAKGTDNTFDDGLESPLFALSGDGKSEQVTTNGKQLIDFYNPTSKSSYVSYSFENDILVVSNTEGSYQKVTFALGDLIKNNQGKKICFTYDNFLYEGDTMTNLVIVDDSGTHYNALITSLGNKREYTIPEDTSNIISSRIEINSNNSSTPQLGKLTITKPLIYFGELNNPPVYEQYSNGIPSPSPDYPQEINSIEGSVEFACEGKNLLRIDDLAEKVINGVTISIKNNEIFLNGTVSESGNPYITQVYTKNLKGTYSVKLFEKNPVSSAFRIYLKNQNNEEIISLTNLDGKYTKYINSNMTSLLMYFNKGTVFSNYKLSIMLVEGDNIPTEYEPCIEPNEVTFDLGQEKLRSVGDVKDELVVDLDTGDYYKLKNIEHLELAISNMDNSEAYPGWINAEKINEYYPNINNLIGDIIQFKSNITINKYSIGFNTIGQSSIIWLEKGKFNLTQTQWKEQYPDLVFELDYNIPSTEPIKLGTLSAEDLAKLKTFKGYNNVTVNTNLGLMNIRFTYGLDIKKYIDNKLAEISSALIEEG